MFCLSSTFESLGPSLSPFQFASDATAYCIFQTNDEYNLNLYIFMHYNNTCDSVRSYFLKAQNEKKSNYPLCWVKRVCFQIWFSLSLSLQFVRQIRTAVNSVQWIHATLPTDVCSSSVYVTIRGIEQIKINCEFELINSFVWN